MSLSVHLFYPKTRCTFPNSETLPFIQGYFLPAVWEHPYADRADGDDIFVHANTSPTHLICLQTHTDALARTHSHTHTHTQTAGCIDTRPLEHMHLPTQIITHDQACVEAAVNELLVCFGYDLQLHTAPSF